jgi:hypothetical protein
VVVCGYGDVGKVLLLRKHPNHLCAQYGFEVKKLNTVVGNDIVLLQLEIKISF